MLVLVPVLVLVLVLVLVPVLVLILGSESSELVRVVGLRVTLNHLRCFIDLGLIKGSL